jgi:hypothetical protein
MSLKSGRQNQRKPKRIKVKFRRSSIINFPIRPDVFLTKNFAKSFAASPLLHYSIERAGEKCLLNGFGDRSALGVGRMENSLSRIN